LGNVQSRREDLPQATLNYPIKALNDTSNVRIEV